MWPALSLIPELSDWIMELLLVANKRGLHLFSPSNNSNCFLSARQTNTRNITMWIMGTAQLYRGEFLSFLPFHSIFQLLLVPFWFPLILRHPLVFPLSSLASSSCTLSPPFSTLPSFHSCCTSLSFPPLSSALLNSSSTPPPTSPSLLADCASLVGAHSRLLFHALKGAACFSFHWRTMLRGFWVTACTRWPWERFCTGSRCGANIPPNSYTHTHTQLVTLHKLHTAWN